MLHSIKRRFSLALLTLCTVIMLPVMAGMMCDPGNMFTVGPSINLGEDSGSGDADFTGAAGTGFNSATRLTIPDDEMFVVSGTLTDAAVFDIGPVAPGDRVRVTVEAAQNSTLDPVLAVFDEDRELFSTNDDINLAAGNLNSAIDEIVSEPSDQFFVAIARFFLDNGGGAYVASIQINRGGSFPTPPAQTLLLNFSGGPATIVNEGTFNLDPFNAADIDDAYDGETTFIREKIIEVIEENFAGFGITIVSSTDNPSLEPGTFSTLHFGAFSPTKFGVADQVDVGNLDRCDDGIIFTEGFDNPFALQPSPTGIAIAIGNVAAHEAGHLLGLNHVADVTALMDNTGSASTLLADQNFKSAVLSPSIFMFGNQNAVKLLNRVIPGN